MGSSGARISGWASWDLKLTAAWTGRSESQEESEMAGDQGWMLGERGAPGRGQGCPGSLALMFGFNNQRDRGSDRNCHKKGGK